MDGQNIFMVINFGEIIEGIHWLMKGMLTQITILTMTSTYLGTGQIGL